jgi:hypothetical protein
LTTTARFSACPPPRVGAFAGTAETEVFTDSQIDAEKCRTLRVISRNNRVRVFVADVAVRINQTQLITASANCPKVGRSVNKESPLRSTPLVILNGLPELAMINGLTEIPHGIVKFPPTVKL